MTIWNRWHAMVRTFAVCALVAGLLPPALAAGQAAPSGSGSQPAREVSPNIRMSGPQAPMPQGRLGRPAGAIVGDPTGQYLVAAWETMHGTCGGSFRGPCAPPEVPGITTVGYSTDGGRTWIEIGPPYLGGNIMTSGRTWLDRGGVDNQTYFLASRAASVEAEVPNMDGTPGGANQSGILIYRGRFQDGRFAWTDQHLVTPSRPDLDLLRSPSLVAAKDGSGRVWLAVSTLRGVCGRRGTSQGEISVYRSPDEGRTWEAPVVVGPDETPDTPDPKDPRCGTTGSIQILPSMALGPEGELYVVWQHGPTLFGYNPFTLSSKTTIQMARSLDGGQRFTSPFDIALVNSMRYNPPVAYSKNTMNDIPRIAVASSGPHRGRIYVTYTSAVEEAPSFDNVQNLKSSQVYLIYSDDKAVTWSQPVPLGPPVPETGLKRFWPVAAARADGTVDVAFLESQERQVTPDPDDIECKIGMVNKIPRAGKASSLIDLYWAQSTDGGATFSAPVRVTSESSNWCEVKFDFETTQYANFGDLIDLFTAGDRAFVVWPDGRDGVPEAYFAELHGSGGAASGETKRAPQPSTVE